jgi:mannose-6-phosphate isomerase-like protein (cupin superfamily)
MRLVKKCVCAVLLVAAAGIASAQMDQPEKSKPAAPAADNQKGMAMNNSGVVYFGKQSVEESFAKGGVLYKFSPEHPFQINTARRTEPGIVEVHVTDADVMYILEGAVTMVTGGTVVDPKTIGLNEIRGTSVTGGETHHLGKGDMIVIPKNTPHWMKEVQGPVLYLVIKTRY